VIGFDHYYDHAYDHVCDLYLGLTRYVHPRDYDHGRGHLLHDHELKHVNQTLPYQPLK
jgi:hypothetical protein